MTKAQQLATIIIRSKGCLYSRWLEGGDNTVADSLSWDFHIPSNILSQLLLCSVPNQVPFGLRIQALPEEISSWLTCLLWNQPCKRQWLKEPMRCKLTHGLDIQTTSPPLDVSKIHSLTTSHELNDIEYLQHALTPSEGVDLALKITQSSNQNSLEPPWILWHRPLSWLTSLTQDWTERMNLPLPWQLQLRHYSNTDKPVTLQVAVTGSILREFYKLSTSSSSNKALCELFIGAFFFAMRSCEYVKVSGYR